MEDDYRRSRHHAPTHTSRHDVYDPYYDEAQYDRHYRDTRRKDKKQRRPTRKAQPYYYDSDEDSSVEQPKQRYPQEASSNDSSLDRFLTGFDERQERKKREYTTMPMHLTKDAKKEQPKTTKSEDQPKQREVYEAGEKEPESKTDRGHDFDDFRKSYLYGGRAGHEDNSSED